MKRYVIVHDIMNGSVSYREGLDGEWIKHSEAEAASAKWKAFAEAAEQLIEVNNRMRERDIAAAVAGERERTAKWRALALEAGGFMLLYLGGQEMTGSRSSLDRPMQRCCDEINALRSQP